jgi:hypothetical protein
VEKQQQVKKAVFSGFKALGDLKVKMESEGQAAARAAAKAEVVSIEASRKTGIVKWGAKKVEPAEGESGGEGESEGGAAAAEAADDKKKADEEAKPRLFKLRHGGSSMMGSIAKFKINSAFDFPALAGAAVSGSGVVPSTSGASGANGASSSGGGASASSSSGAGATGAGAPSLSASWAAPAGAGMATASRTAQAPGDRPFVRPLKRAAFAERGGGLYGGAGGNREAPSMKGGGSDQPPRLALAPRTKSLPVVEVAKEFKPSAGLQVAAGEPGAALAAAAGTTTDMAGTAEKEPMWKRKGPSPPTTALSKLPGPPPPSGESLAAGGRPGFLRPSERGERPPQDRASLNRLDARPSLEPTVADKGNQWRRPQAAQPAREAAPGPSPSCSGTEDKIDDRKQTIKITSKITIRTLERRQRMVKFGNALGHQDDSNVTMVDSLNEVFLMDPKAAEAMERGGASLENVNKAFESFQKKQIWRALHRQHGLDMGAVEEEKEAKGLGGARGCAAGGKYVPPSQRGGAGGSSMGASLSSMAVSVAVCRTPRRGQGEAWTWNS